MLKSGNYSGNVTKVQRLIFVHGEVVLQQYATAANMVIALHETSRLQPRCAHFGIKRWLLCHCEYQNGYKKSGTLL